MEPQEHSRVLETLRSEPDPTRLATFTRSLHPADLAVAMEELDPERRLIVFACLETPVAAQLLDELSPEVQQELLSLVPLAHASDILEEMPPDEAADLLGELSDEAADRLLDSMDAEDAADVRELLEHEYDTAGGQMTTEFIAVPETMTVQNTIDHLRELTPDAETIYTLYVVDTDDHLVGVLSLRTLIVSQPDQRVADIMSRDVITVGVEADQEDAAELIARYNLVAVPVVDEDGRLAGIITVDDAVDVIGEEAAEDIHEMAPDWRDDGMGAILLRRSRRALVVVGQAVVAGALLLYVSGALRGTGLRPGPLPAQLCLLPVVLLLSWLFELQARASLMARTAGVREADSPAWSGWWLELGAALALAVGCAVVAALLVFLRGGHSPGWEAVPVGVSLASGLLCAVLAAYLFPRAVLHLWPNRDRLPVAPTLAAHFTGLLAYVSVSTVLLRGNPTP